MHTLGGLQHTTYGRLNGVGMWLTFWANCPLRRRRKPAVKVQQAIREHREWVAEMEHFDRNGAFGYWIGEDARPLAPGAEPYAIDADMRPEAPDYDTRELDCMEERRADLMVRRNALLQWPGLLSDAQAQELEDLGRRLRYGYTPDDGTVI